MAIYRNPTIFMKKRISRIAPLQLGVVLGLLLFVLSLLYLPIVLLLPAFGAKPSGHGWMAVGLFLLLLAPVLYAMIGFIGGVILAVVYNLLAQWTGGIEFTLTDTPQPPTLVR